jgi:hypothetical protein
MGGHASLNMRMFSSLSKIEFFWNISVNTAWYSGMETEISFKGEGWSRLVKYAHILLFRKLKLRKLSLEGCDGVCSFSY